MECRLNKNINVKIRMYIFDCLGKYNFVQFLLGGYLTKVFLNGLTIFYFRLYMIFKLHYLLVLRDVKSYLE